MRRRTVSRETLPRSLGAGHFTQPTHLHNGINRAGFLAETTVDALGHVNVIACRPAAAICSWLGLNGDGLREWPQVTVILADPSWPRVCPSRLSLTPGGLHGCPPKEPPLTGPESLCQVTLLSHKEKAMVCFALRGPWTVST